MRSLRHAILQHMSFTKQAGAQGISGKHSFIHSYGTMCFTWLDISIQTSDFQNTNLYFCNYVMLNKELILFNILRQFIRIFATIVNGFFSFYTYFLFAYSKAIDFFVLILYASNLLNVFISCRHFLERSLRSFV